MRFSYLHSANTITTTTVTTITATTTTATTTTTTTTTTATTTLPTPQEPIYFSHVSLSITHYSLNIYIISSPPVH